MEAILYSLKGEKKGKVSLPDQFSEPVRKDIIKRAVLSIQSHGRQPHGTDPRAGNRSSAQFQGRRSSYGTWANKALHRTQRIRVGSGNMTGTARNVPHAVKGRAAHPPEVSKVWDLKINIKERRKAIRSAIAATANKSIVVGRGHKAESLDSVPIILDDSFEAVKKTKDVAAALNAVGLADELERASQKKVRAGKGTMRGRKYQRKKGPLIVIESDKGVAKAARALAGVDVTSVRSLNAEILAPGTHPGRITVWTKGAIEALSKEKLFK